MGVQLPRAVEDLLRVSAPILAGALAGPFGPVAAAIASGALNAWLGPPVLKGDGTPVVSPAEIISAVQQNGDKPDFLIAVRQAELDLEKFQIESGIRFAEIEQKDRASARTFAQESGTASRAYGLGWTILAVDAAITITALVGGFLLLTGNVHITDQNVVLAVFTLVGGIVGRISARADTFVNFVFGSSESSKRHGDDLGAAVQQMGQALGDAAATSPIQTAPAAPPSVVVLPQPATPPPSAPTGPSRFISLVEKLLDHEGGYVNDPADPGGCTNMGITLATLRDWRHDATLTCEDVHSLTKDQAKAVYFAKYFNALCCGDLPPGVDYIVFDMGVNAGVSCAARMLQQVLSKRDPSLKVDGVVGPLTLTAMAKASPRAVIEEFHAARMEFYRELPTWARFGSGWQKRADAVLADALAAAAA